jgi:hypothetical protein
VILPPYVRRSPRVESVLPLLYLHGLSSGDFREALPALLGPEAAGLSSSAILRLTKSWTAEYEAFRRRDLADRDYVYLWADGVHFTIRLGAGSRTGGLVMAFKLLEVAQGHWRCIDAAELVPLVRAGVGFKDGIQVEPQQTRKKAAA